MTEYPAIGAPRPMTEDDIPAFIAALIEAGANICAVGHERYCIGDADMEDPKACEQVQRIAEGYGDRDHLLLQIVAHLRSQGRYIDIDEMK